MIPIRIHSLNFAACLLYTHTCLNVVINCKTGGYFKGMVSYFTLCNNRIFLNYDGSIFKVSMKGTISDTGNMVYHYRNNINLISL